MFLSRNIIAAVNLTGRDPKSGKRHEKEAQLGWQKACELGFRGNLSEWGRLMGAAQPVTWLPHDRNCNRKNQETEWEHVKMNKRIQKRRPLKSRRKSSDHSIKQESRYENLKWPQNKSDLTQHVPSK